MYLQKNDPNTKVIVSDLISTYYKCESCNFIKKEKLVQMFSCEFCKISKYNFFTEHLWATASVIILLRSSIKIS